MKTQRAESANVYKSQGPHKSFPVLDNEFDVNNEEDADSWVSHEIAAHPAGVHYEDEEGVLD